ncbi:Versican core protein [Stylophora pistillata]|uniref:Versican core protein n=1 Tax=Stylophora pistillata TaxID=50429 RepID=A0A2B4RCF7_STYPI|nr:Versican core protein [Stylophora pistillata]
MSNFMVIVKKAEAWTPCSSSPCQNGGTCSANYEENTFNCLCVEGFIGAYCEKDAVSCKELHEANKLNGSLVVTLRFNTEPVSILCQMGDFGWGAGPWTPIMKTNGNQNTFHFDSVYWTDLNSYNLPGGLTGFDDSETKLPTYWSTPFSKICLGMKVDQQLRFIVINQPAASLHSLIADGQYRATSQGRDTWKTLLGSQGSLQLNCNKEGFNSASTNSGSAKTRIGIVSNEGSDGCYSCDSRIGYGGANGADNSNTCGNVANWSPDNGDKNIKAMGYILAQ